DQPRVLVDGLAGRRAGHGEAGHDLGDLDGRVAPEQPDVVPVLGEPARSKLLQPACNFGDGGHGCVTPGPEFSPCVRSRAIPCVQTPGADHSIPESTLVAPKRRARSTGMIPRTELVRNTSSALPRSSLGTAPRSTTWSRSSRARSRTSPRMTPGTIGPSTLGVS